MIKFSARTAVQILIYSQIVVLFLLSHHFAILQSSSLQVIRVLDWSSSGKLAIGRNDGMIEIIDAQTGQVIDTVQPTDTTIRDIAWHPTDPNKLAVASGFGILTIVDLANPQEWIFPDPVQEIYAIAWSPGGNKIVGAVTQNPLPNMPPNAGLIWDALTGQVLTILPGHQEPLSAVGWSPDGLRIISGSFDSTAIIWNVTASALSLTVQPLFTLHPTGFTVTAVEWRPYSSQVATVSDGDDGVIFSEVQVWDRDTGQVVSSYRGEQIREIAWSPTGNLMAIADGYNVQILNFLTGQISNVTQDTGLVWALAWSPSGEQIVYSSSSLTNMPTTVEFVNSPIIEPTLTLVPSDTPTDIPTCTLANTLINFRPYD